MQLKIEIKVLQSNMILLLKKQPRLTKKIANMRTKIILVIMRYIKEYNENYYTGLYVIPYINKNPNFNYNDNVLTISGVTIELKSQEVHING